ncbi:MAG: hypothetical protein IT195_07495 [Microthrixaceae bacterium]|nr:hypothetical protein [Microthrixaceae bacterium]
MGSRIYEDGDFAANSILIDRALDGRLLVGNYSRVGFHHPGPAILDAQAFGQALFHRILGVVPTPFNGQFLGVLLLNATCIGAAAAIVRRRLGSTAAALALPAVVFVINRWEPWGLSSTWMPHTYIAPFLLLCVAAASVLTASRHDLRYLAFSGGLLVHGHVSFVMFVGVTVLVAVATGILLRRRGVSVELLRREWIPWAWASAVVVAFALPVVLNLVYSWPGELERYANYAGDRQGFQQRSFGDVLRFLGHYWTRDAAAGAALIAFASGVAAGTAGWVVRRWRLPLAGIAVVVVLEAALVLLYAQRGVDNLGEPYIGLFALSGPVLVLWSGSAGLLGLVERVPELVWRRGLGALVVVACGALTIATAAIANPYRGFRGPEFVKGIGPGAVRLEFATPGWPWALGLVEQLRRRGREVCVLNPVWEILVTDELICDSRSPGRLIVVYGPGETPPRDAVVYDDGAVVMVRG